jgi:DNA replication ATP-dependent helicase Dna2
MSHPNPPRRPLQPVSEVTKSKLNKFQYQAKDDSELEEKIETPAKASIGNEMTPQGRLSWRDLLEPSLSTDEEPVNPSPNDRLLWDNRQDPHYMAALSPMLSRGKKRARSSSPVSSPAAEHPKTPAVNVQKLAQALKTPNADPTLELWDRYSLNGPESISAQQGLTNPALAQLMISSSPTPTKKLAASARAGSGSLRRAISAGLGLTKRRKIEKSRSAGHVSNSQRELEAASKSSLVSALLDSVTSSIHEPSPRNQRVTARPSPKPEKQATPEPIVAPSKPAAVIKPEASSDYGDDDFDDFDDDTFMDLEASISTPSALQPAKSIVSAPSEPPALRQPGSSDEFGDIDEAISEGTKVVPTVPSKKEGLPVPQQKALSALDSAMSDDEFGDDFDADLDLDAIEFAATQSLKKTSTAVPAVRL